MNKRTSILPESIGVLCRRGKYFSSGPAKWWSQLWVEQRGREGGDSNRPLTASCWTHRSCSGREQSMCAGTITGWLCTPRDFATQFYSPKHVNNARQTWWMMTTHCLRFLQEHLAVLAKRGQKLMLITFLRRFFLSKRCPLLSNIYIPRDRAGSARQYEEVEVDSRVSPCWTKSLLYSHSFV